MLQQKAFAFSPSLYHRALAERTSPTFRYAGGDVGAWQQALRTELRERLGCRGKAAERGPLAVRSLWKRDHALGSIERIVFAAEPRVDVPAYVCVPKETEPLYTWFVCLQGHTMFHCVCNYVPGLLRVAEMGDIAGLIAPRPLVIVSGREDGIFPLAPARAEFEHVQQIYRAAGAADRCAHVIGNGGHRFYADDAWRAMLHVLRNKE